ncbi:unnamed protein product [Diamesa tonsa]
MKRRADEIAYSTARAGTTPAHHRIITSPQHTNNNNNNNSPAATQIQYQIAMKNDGGPPANLVNQPPQSIQFSTYNPSASIGNPIVNINKTNVSQNQSGPQVHVVNTVSSVNSVRHKSGTGTITPTSQNVASPGASAAAAGAVGNVAQPVGGQNQFQRLKVEDALSYLDQVKYKFGNQPQVYNDFLDIMKEFKSQSIDTPGVIQRVSNLFKGHPELIVGFNTFLPPGYKIEVQANDQGYAYQVSVSVPSPSGNITMQQTQPSPPHKMQILTGSGQIAHPISPAVNLITQHTSHQQTIHVQQSQQPQQDQQRSVQNPQIQTITIAQNYSRDRERSGTTGNAITQSPQQQQQSQAPSTPTTPQQQQQQGANQHQTTNNSVINDSAGLHRISQQLLQSDNQPVQFNQAIVYVNKIKCRFQEQPEKYKRFLRILHTYQNEQRKKDGTGKIFSGAPLTEGEVFAQVANLFDNQEDLLREFGQFLPDATSPSSNSSGVKNNTAGHNDANEKISNVLSNQHANVKSIGNNISRNNLMSPMDLYQPAPNEKDNFHMQAFSQHLARDKDNNRNHMNSNPKYGNVQIGPNNNNNNNTNSSGASSIKRSPAIPLNHLNRPADRNEPPVKRHKPICRDVSFADAARYGTMSDYAFFDKVRKALRTSDVYDNFLRCLTLYNQEIVSKAELSTLVTPFLNKTPDLLRWFQEFLGPSTNPEGIPLASAQRQDHRAQTDMATEIDLTQCKRLGASYCALPKTSELKKCSGRTALCREVLNDTWVSFPSWAEDSTFVTSRKTQYEEFIYRCEDERFELDVVIETNNATIRVLEGVQKRVSRMTAEEVNRFRLDDYLGGTSQTIHQRALRRIYGEKACDIIQGMKKNPVVAVPVVLRRLKTKEEEWREAQKGFNQLWREQNEKYYLKSLDHQGINFKQNDIKALRSKSLMNEIETIYEERNEGNNGDSIPGPHLVLSYKDKSILDDAANLLIHHVKRQTGIQKQEKARIKHILRQFIPELFFAPRQPLSDDEREDGDESISVNNNAKSNSRKSVELNSIKVEIKQESDADKAKNNAGTINSNVTSSLGGGVLPPHAAAAKHPDEAYSLFYANNNWYYFLRLHAILCDRLRTMYDKTQALSAEEDQYRATRRESTAVALRLKPHNEIEIPDYYPAFLDMLKNLLDGNVDATSYEDKLRDMYGIHAYIAFTLDRVVANAVRQLQFCVTERNALECFELYQLESRKSATGGPCATAQKRVAAELAYQRRAEASLQEEMYFKVFIYKYDCRVTIEMLDNDTEDASSTTFENAQASNKYVDRYTNPASNTSAGMNNRSNSHNNGPFTDIEIKTEKPDDDATPYVRKALFLQRNIKKFNRRNLTVSGRAKLLISNEENGELPNKAVTATIAASATSTTTISSTIVTSSTVSTIAGSAAIIQNENSTSITTSATTSTTTLTTSSSGVPPPLVLPTIQKIETSPLWNKRPPERLGQANAFGDCFVDDSQQIKLNVQSYKTVFLTKGYILYRKNSLKRAKQTHPKVTKSMHQRFFDYVQRWQVKNVSDLQRITINDWLLGRNQNDLVPNKTSIRKDNNLLKTPYSIYNRYTVEYPAENAVSS